MSLCYYYENKIEESMKLIDEALKIGETELKKSGLKEDEIYSELCSLYIFVYIIIIIYFYLYIYRRVTYYH